MDIMTMAMCQPKVIDLDAFGITERMLEIVAYGGGAANVDAATIHGNTFWDETRTNRPLMVRFTYNAVRVTLNVIRIYFEDDNGGYGQHAAICFEAPMFQDLTSVVRVIVQLGHISDNSNSVNVRVVLNTV